MDTLEIIKSLAVLVSLLASSATLLKIFLSRHDKKIEELQAKVNALEAKVQLHETGLAVLTERLNHLIDLLERIERKLDATSNK